MSSNVEKLVRPEAAWAYASVWTNPIFVGKKRQIRLWRTSLRASPFGYFLIFLSIVAMSFVMYWVLYIPSFFVPYIAPIIQGPFFGVILGWRVGKALAKASPYRRTTGEGFASYLYVKADTKLYFLGRLLNRKVATNTYLSVAGTGKKQEVECIEWLGTARVPRAPKRKTGMFDTDTIQISLPPRSVEIPRKRRVREKEFF